MKISTLPQAYLQDMKELLGEHYGEFLACYEKPAVKGLRFHQKKARPETIEKLIDDWRLEPVPWCPSGYYYPEEVRPGLSPYHDAGVYYMQEPSAMSVVEEAGIGADDVVLDLCAAPGGKSTAAAERCKFLLSNEIIPNRAKILSSNIERMGFENVIVTNAGPEDICEALTELFSVVFVDAPCSGEGMMRRDETAVSEWSEENVAMCITRQAEILKQAAKAVAPGGKLVYSTCTFEKGENEDQIQKFLESNPDFSLQHEKRMMPQNVRGEGHYVAVLRKAGNLAGASWNDAMKSVTDEACLQMLTRMLRDAGIHILRAGMMKGEFFADKKKNRIYEPSHAEIMASDYAHAQAGVNLLNETDALNYLHGEMLRLDLEDAQVEIKGPDGFCGVYFDGYPLGLGKRQGQVVKNHLPKGLRR